MVSHDLNLAAMYGDSLLLLKAGEVIRQGTPTDVLSFKVLEETYGCTILVDQSGLGGFPRVTPVPRRMKDEAGNIRPRGKIDHSAYF